MTRSRQHSVPPPGHVMASTAVIGALSITLVTGLWIIGFIGNCDAIINAAVSRGGRETFPKHLPIVIYWAATALFAFGLAFTIVSCPGTGRRILLWLTSIVLIAAWAPILSLAAYAPNLSAPWIAALWSGVCALVYTSSHQMPCDLPPNSET